MISAVIEAAEPDPRRVSTLELFFDLVFVFTLTQLTATLTHAPTWTGLGQVALMIGVIWWMYGGYAWLTNAVVLDGTGRRVLLLGGMGAYLVLALAVPRAFDGDGLAFGLAYLTITLIHIGLFTRATGRGGRGILRIAPYNVAAALIIVAGGVIGGSTQYVLWALAFALEWGVPWLVPPQAFFEIEPAHFVERHGLVVIIGIGESVVAIGIGASGLALDPALIGAVLLGLSLSAGLWLAYFGGDDERAERALAEAGDDRPRLALESFGVWHLPILLGIVAIAFGQKQALGHAFEPSDIEAALGLGAGVATFLVGDVGFRRSLRIHEGWGRVVAIPAALATLPLGTEVAPAAQLAALVAILAGALWREGRPEASDDAAFDDVWNRRPDPTSP
jgi:low temperature requirement protein LtrA